MHSWSPVKGNILLQGRKHRPALAQPVGTAGMKGGRADPAPVPGAAVAAGPADHPANMQGKVVRSNTQIFGYILYSHKALIACRIGSLQGVAHTPLAQ